MNIPSPFGHRLALVALGIVVAAVLTAWPRLAQADAQLAQDVRTLEQCVRNEIRAGRRPWNCVEAIVRPCLARTQETTADMHMCLRRSIGAWDAILNDKYQTLMRGWENAGQPEPRDMLRNAQRAWITFRDTACDAQAFLYRGGTLHGLIVGSCIEQHTAIRAIDLMELVRDQNQ